MKFWDEVAWIQRKEERNSTVLCDKLRLCSNDVISVEIRECHFLTTEFMNSESWIINLFSLTEMSSTEDEDVEMSSERVIYLCIFNQF